MACASPILQTFTVKTLTSEVLRVELAQSATAGELKVALCTPPRDGWWDTDRIKLCCNGRTLADGDSLIEVAQYLNANSERYIVAMVRAEKSGKVDPAKIDRLFQEAKAANPSMAAMGEMFGGGGQGGPFGAGGAGADFFGPQAFAAAMQAVNGSVQRSAGAEATANIDVFAKRTVVALVKCASVELKLTLGDRLLGKPLVKALIEPFLGAYNKKMGANGGSSLTVGELLSVEVDGDEVVDLQELAGVVLVNEAPKVRLRIACEG